MSYCQAPGATDLLDTRATKTTALDIDEEQSTVINALHHNELMNFSYSACPEVRLDRQKGLVIIYLYQDKRAKHLDLKIDTVIAARVVSKLGFDWVRGVEVHYFDNNDQSKFILALIDMASVPLGVRMSKGFLAVPVLLEARVSQLMIPSRS